MTGTKRDGECIFQCQYYPSLRLQTVVLLQVLGRSERFAKGDIGIGFSSSDNLNAAQVVRTATSAIAHAQTKYLKENSTISSTSTLDIEAWMLYGGPLEPVQVRPLVNFSYQFPVPIPAGTPVKNRNVCLSTICYRSLSYLKLRSVPLMLKFRSIMYLTVL